MQTITLAGGPIVRRRQRASGTTASEPGRARDAQLVVALDRVERGQAGDPELARSREAVERERVRLALALARSGQRLPSRRGAVAVHVAGAGLEHRRGQARAGAHRGDERIDEAGRRTRDRGERDADLAARDRRRERERIATAGVAAARVHGEPRREAGGIGDVAVGDDDDLVPLGQARRGKRVELRAQHRRVAADEQDAGVDRSRRLLGRGREPRQRRAGPRTSRDPPACRARASGPASISLT